MMRRRPVARTVARTAVIAGTATAVSGRVAARQNARAQGAQAPPLEQPTVAAAAPATSVEQLTALAALRQQGVLTDAEFETEKAKILSR
jgi:hypothetical protein